MKRVVTTLAWLYAGITFSAFLLSMFGSMTGWRPSNLQDSWSDLGSFVKTKDGIILVSIRMWDRSELYDRSGTFLEPSGALLQKETSSRQPTKSLRLFPPCQHRFQIGRKR
jgi:hypothetical protein